MDVVRSDISMILVPLDLLRHGLLADYIDMLLICKSEGCDCPLLDHHRHIFWRWRTSSVHYSRLYLLKLHRHFHHASPEKF